MSRPRFLADHALTEHIVTGVVRRESTLEFGRGRDLAMRERSDAEGLAYVADNRWIVISHDVNPMPNAAYERSRSGQKMAGLLMVKQRAPVGLIVDSLLLIWSASAAAEWEGHVCFFPLH